MKLSHETFLTSSIVIGLTSLLYSYIVLHRKVKSLDDNVNLIMSTHLLYMENRNEQTEQIKSINSTLESIALSSPFRGEEWKSKYIRDKINRDLEKHITTDERQSYYEIFKPDHKFYDYETTEAVV